MDEPEQFWKPIPPYDDRGWDLVPPIEECGEPLVDITGRTPRILCGASYLRQGLDGALDRLADVVREHLDLKAIYRILQLKR